MPTAISMMDNKIDRSLTGGWQYLYNFNKVAGESMPGVAIGMATGGAGVIGEIAGVAGAAGIYGGSAYGNSKSYAIQNGYSNGEATDFATEVGFKEGCKTMIAYGILRGASGLSRAGYCSGTTAATTAGIGTFGLEFIDETYTTPKIYKDTLGQDIEVDYGEAARNSAIVATISGAATYVASRQRGTTVEQVEGEGIYEKAHALDGVEEIEESTLTGQGQYAQESIKNEGKRLLPGEGDIGTYNDLIKSGKRGDNLTPHHMPSAEYMSKKGVAKKDGLCMNMEMPVPGSGGRHRLTDTYGGNMTDAKKAFYYDLSPRDALAYDLKNLCIIYQNDGLYDKIRPQLLEYIKTSKSLYQDLFEK
ncbi:hypothetical protein [Pseudobutyrivibrio sp. MD2005]|uniref:hypothetical protein n=1 Tax=Pseudobutyrivibrio sp. MD2005 TaxID=1410616 RepID=UPI000AB94894|nr:hypothetical protein [Pseudobutyrivibrio sp. MD2005]